MAHSKKPDTPHSPSRTVYRLEAAMLVVVVLFAASLLLLSLEYSYPDDAFPQVLSAIVIVTGLLLLFRDYVPINILQGESGASLPGEHSSEDIDGPSEDAPGPVTIKAEEVYTLLLIGAYAVSGILVGLFWATPMFAFVFLWWRGWPLKQRIIVAVASLIIPYFFMRYLYLDLMSGVLF